MTNNQPKSKRFSGIGLNIAISIGAIVVALILLEVGVRIFMPAPEPTRYSEHMGWRGKANDVEVIDTDGYKHTLRLNSKGMHDTEHSFEKPPNTYRVLMLGDSFVEARQVDETVTAHQVLENLLNEAGSDRQFSVISAGVPAWGAGQQLMYYKTEGRLYQPDLVFLMVYLGNDITDNLPVHSVTVNDVTYYAPYFPICDGELELDPWVYAPGVKPAIGRCAAGQKLLADYLDWLYWNSRIYSLLAPLVNRLQIEFFSKNLPYFHLYVPLDNQVFRETYARENELLDYSWRLMFGLIEELNRHVTNDGATLVVVLIDHADVINVAALPPEQQEARAREVPYLAEARLDIPEQQFRQALSGDNIPILNLQPFLIEATQARGESLYYPHDKHWTVTGNRVVAETLYRWLGDNIHSIN